MKYDPLYRKKLNDVHNPQHNPRRILAMKLAGKSLNLGRGLTQDEWLGHAGQKIQLTKTDRDHWLEKACQQLCGERTIGDPRFSDASRQELGKFLADIASEMIREVRKAYPPPSRAAGRTGARSSKNDRRGRTYLIFPSWSKNAIGGFTYNLAKRIASYKFEPGVPYDVWCSDETTKSAEGKMLSHVGRIGKREWCRATRELAAAYGMTEVPNL
jgi:hypothetical protein